ncbi:MAG: hypothetical protein KBS70_07355 [Bacteroidales bacterium]|nr:hypothetical protein [Candidatus Colicola equi]
MVIDEFPIDYKCSVIAADTETHTFIDGELLSTDEIQRIFAEQDVTGSYIHGQSWAREHVSVSAYAWLISDGIYFAWLDTFEEFINFCHQHFVDTVWWYNAKFDFSFIDYEILSSGKWELSTSKKLKDHQYSSLHGDQGQRYKLSICIERKREQISDRHYRSYTTNHYDFANIFGGGLKQLLDSFDVKDYDGNDIRKLEMDYQGEITDESINYMKNDVFGLYHLIRIASDFLQQETGYTLLTDKVMILTAGGLAKKVLLRSLYGKEDLTDTDQIKKEDKMNVSTYQSIHRMSIELDQTLRHKHLYVGGKTIANKDYLNKLVKRNIYYYDRNSMYPSEMAIMPDLIGGLSQIDEKYIDYFKSHGYQIIYELKDYGFHVKDGCLPVMYDFFTSQYVESFIASDYNNRTFMIFDFELEELSNFYDISTNYEAIYVIRKSENPGYKRFIDKWYTKKAESKKAKNGVLSAFSKLMLNSSYGKLSQNPMRHITHREISEETEAVHLVEDGEEISDEKSLLSVIQGSYITAKARCALMSFMREVCGGAENTREHIFYCDTDSIQTDIEYKYPDAYKLGGWKLEEGRPFTGGKWLAPKTYVLWQEIDGKREFVVHSKGVQTKVLSGFFGAHTSDKDIDDIFSPGRSYQTLCGLNVRGGKALLPLEKQLCRVDNLKLSNGDIVEA